MTDLRPQSNEARFPPSRSEALDRLENFAPKAGRAYADGRNTDAGPDAAHAVSKLSPYVRYRLITEQEIVAAVLGRYPLEVAEKFIQEVLWRTYWKGWLEMRPAVWTRFLAERDHHRETFADAREVADAERGATGIDGFDDWARELVGTGYLHNHARMWFASIWIFTLRLPWALGADFFLRHLLDADAASNTLSWRWVAGLQTAGKTYLATADNIARFTNGRFAPVGLARQATALTEPPIEAPAGLPATLPDDPGQPSLLLVTHDDMHPESLFSKKAGFERAMVAAGQEWLWGDAARRFVRTAAADATSRISAHFGCPAELVDCLDAATLVTAARAAGVQRISVPYAPVGPVADALTRLTAELSEEGVTLHRVRRDWDETFWPYARKGFFAFKEHIPSMLGEGWRS